MQTMRAKKTVLKVQLNSFCLCGFGHVHMVPIIGSYTVSNPTVYELAYECAHYLLTQALFSLVIFTILAYSETFTMLIMLIFTRVFINQ